MKVKTKKWIFEDVEELIKMPLDKASERIRELNETWVSVESLLKHIKDMPDNNVKSELMSLLGGY